MKRFVFFLSMLLVGSALYAENVPVDSARIVAAHVLGTTPDELVDRTSELNIQISAAYRGYVYLFVPSSGVGFALISAYDHAIPVLAYSTTSLYPFTSTTAQTTISMVYWIVSQYAYDIRRSSGTSQVLDQWSQWKNGIPAPADSVIAPMLTSTWSQTSYYQQQTPGNRPAGSGAIAMAQVMRYWNYPDQGYGNVSYTPSGYGTEVSVDFETTYAWGDMPDALDSYSTAAQCAAVSQLIFHAGASVQTAYSASTTITSNQTPLYYTDATNPSIARALNNNFTYRPTISRLSRAAVSDNVWDSTLKAELYASRPVILAINGNRCHSVVDGCDGRGYYHVNWGNGGQGDGYFAIGNVVPNYNNTNTALKPHALVGIEPVGNFSLVSAVANNEEWGSVRGGHRYPLGSTAVLSATAVLGYRFDRWNDGGTDNPRSFVVEGNRTDTAIFVYVGEVAVNGVPNNAVWGSVSGSGVRLCGDTITLRATPVLGSRFVHWHDGSTDNPRRFHATEDCTDTAIFEYIGEVTVNGVPNNAAWGSVSGSGVRLCGDTITLRATPALGYRFVRWHDGSTGNPRSFVVDGDRTDTAIFEYVGIATITTTASNLGWGPDLSGTTPWGTVSGGGSYTVGDNVTLTATPASSLYRFDHWQDGVTTNPRSIVATEDRSDTARFIYIGPVAINGVPNNAAWGSVSGSGSYTAQSSTVTLRATATLGCRFVRWHDGGTDNPRRFLAIEDRTDTAIFEYVGELTVNGVANNPAWGSVSGSGTRLYGDTITLQATAALGSRFRRWHDGSTDNPRSLVVEGDRTDTAIFEYVGIATVTTTVSNLGWGPDLSNNTAWGTISGGGSYTVGDNVTLRATPASTRYRFDHWQDGVTTNPRSFTAAENRSDTAYFIYIGPVAINGVPNNAAWGTVSGGKSYKANIDTATLWAKGALGYRFDHWHDGGTDNPRRFLATEDRTDTAYFVYVGTVDITAVSDNPAWGIANGSGTYTIGDSVVLTTTTTSVRYFFSHWHDGGTDNPRFFFAAEDRIDTAYFSYFDTVENSVWLDDTEPHTWSYYSDPTNPVRSLNPADVLITYYGYGVNTLYSSTDAIPSGDPDVDVAAGQVGIGIDVPDRNAYVYLKTLERRGGSRAASKEASTGPCKYRTIPNPFSIRPTYGEGGSRWRGFYKWRVKRLVGGRIYKNLAKTQIVAVGDMVDADQELWIDPVEEFGMQVEFEAIWARAFVFPPTQPAGGINAIELTNADYASGSNAYERNFVVLTNTTSVITNLSYNMEPATITAVYPDGTDGNGTTRLDTVPNVRLDQHFYCMADTKFEYININAPTKAFLGNGYNFTMGRGIQNSNGGISLNCLGGNSYLQPTRTQSNGVYKINTSQASASSRRSANFRVESGTYRDVLPHMCGRDLTTINTVWDCTPSFYAKHDANSLTLYTVSIYTLGSYNSGTGFSTHITFGNDYDRSLSKNDLLIITNFIVGAWKWCRGDLKSDEYIWNVKSGDLHPGRIYRGDSGVAGIYMGSIGSLLSNGSSNTSQTTGRRHMIVEGGLLSSIAGGMNNQATSSDTNVWIRIRGGQVRGAIFAAGDYAAGIGHRRVVITGGTVNGWVAGGANGNLSEQGKLDGSTYLYIGGRARLEPSPEDPMINFSKGGNVFGAGSGNSQAAGETATVGKVYNSTVVIADSCYIARDVYGGGNYGGVTQTGSKIYILGGTVAGKVFGGSNQQGGKRVDIVMRGGKVIGGVYGGSNQLGKVTGPINVSIEGGTVGEEGCADNLGSVFGCGYGVGTSVTGNVQVTIGKSTARCPHVDNPVIFGNVYGGGFNGAYNATGKTFKVTTWNGLIKGNVFGGGFGTTAVITGNTNVNILGTTHVQGNVYGGGNMGKVTGNTKVVIGD